MTNLPLNKITSNGSNLILDILTEDIFQNLSKIDGLSSKTMEFFSVQGFTVYFYLFIVLIEYLIIRFLRNLLIK